MTALVLFAGAGGADVGLAQAGVEHVACLDYDPDCVATLQAAGFLGRQVDLSTADLSEYEGVDLVWASPPCQPHSQAGKRLGSADPRDGWPWLMRELPRVRPTWVVVENVRGIPVDDWIRDLEGLGYTVSAWLLDAVDWGSPSHRTRWYLVAGPRPVRRPRRTHSLVSLARAKWVTGEYWGRHGIEPADWTSPGPRGGQPYLVCSSNPTRAEARALPLLPDGLLPWVTVRDVLPGLGTATVDGEEGSGRAARRGSRAVVTTDFPAPAIRARSKGAPPLRVAPEPWRLDQPAPCVAACEVKGAGGRISSLHGAPRPSKHGLDRASDAALLGAGIRRLTPHECAVLVGLRDHPYIARTVESHYRQVGNTVVPVMAEVIAQALLEAS